MGLSPELRAECLTDQKGQMWKTLEEAAQYARGREEAHKLLHTVTPRHISRGATVITQENEQNVVNAVLTAMESRKRPYQQQSNYSHNPLQGYGQQYPNKKTRFPEDGVKPVWGHDVNGFVLNKAKYPRQSCSICKAREGEKVFGHVAGNCMYWDFRRQPRPAQQNPTAPRPYKQPAKLWPPPVYPDEDTGPRSGQSSGGGSGYGYPLPPYNSGPTPAGGRGRGQDGGGRGRGRGRGQGGGRGRGRGY